MYKIGIIGDRDSVLGFMALGYSVFEVQNSEDAAAKLHELVRSEKYAVLFVVEDIAIAIQEDIEKYKDKPLPAITVIPGSRGSTGYGMENIKNAALRAVGTDMLFDNN